MACNFAKIKLDQDKDLVENGEFFEVFSSFRILLTRLSGLEGGRGEDRKRKRDQIIEDKR